MKFILFGYEFEIAVSAISTKPVNRVKRIIEAEVDMCQPFDVDRKIQAIKILRRADVSKILIEGGLVPGAHIRSNGDKPYVTLGWAKMWVEEQYPHMLRN